MKPQPLSKFALAQTRARLKRVTKELAHATKHPKNPDTAHDLRVAIRRFTQCLRTFEDLLHPGPVKGMRKKLRKLMRLCGAKRDYDVGLGVLAEASVPPDSPVVAKFQEQQHRGLRELARSLEMKGKWNVVEEWRKHLRSRKHVPRTTSPPVSATGAEWDWLAGVTDNVRRNLPRLAEDFFHDGDATAADVGNFEILHPFRLRGKRFRYTLEIFKAVYGSRLDAKLRALGELQDRMGAINDCMVVLKLPGMDRASSAAVRKLLTARDAAFRKYWRTAFSSRRQAAWRSLLAHPKRPRYESSQFSASGHLQK